MLRIRVSTASAEIAETELITAGRRGLECSFEFNAAWAELAKTVIVSGAVSRDIVLVGGTITVPGECVAKENFPLKIGVYGANGDGDIVIPTIWTNFGKILPAAKPSDIKPDEITPNVVAQIQKNSSDALAFARSVVERADAGEFDGRDGVDGEKGDPGPDNVFTAIFGETTGEEICQAYAARKICQLRYPYLTTSNEKVYRLTWCGQYTIIRTGGTTVEWAAVFSQNRNNELTTVEVVGSSWEAPSTVSLAEVRSPVFSGTPRAPTADAGTNTSQIATTAFVQQEISSKYVKPSDGIPATDLASDVQTAIDNAIQDPVGFHEGNVLTQTSSGGVSTESWEQVHDISIVAELSVDANDNLSVSEDTTVYRSIGTPYTWQGKQPAVRLTWPDGAERTLILTSFNSGKAYWFACSSDDTDYALGLLYVSKTGKWRWTYSHSVKYAKPSTGIPKTDLASDVQTSLGKADTALQEHQSLAAYRTAADQDVIDAAQDTVIAGKLSATGNAYRTASIPMGQLDSGSTATVMTATVPGITELRDGVCMWLRNGVIASAAGVTLNINNLGAKPIYNSIADATATTTTFAKAYTMLFIYNSTRVTGGCWDMVYGYDANTTYTPPKLGFGYGTCTTAALTVAKTASISSYTLVAGGIVAIKFNEGVPAGATLNISSKGAKAIYYKGTAITGGVIKAGDTVTMIYSTYYHVLSIDRDVDTLPPSPSDDNPMMDGAPSPGSSTDYARADHVHPSDSNKIGFEDPAEMVTMTASGSTVTCFKSFAQIYLLFSTQKKTYFALAASQTDFKLFNLDRVDGANQTIYLSSIVGGVLSQIVLTPGGTNTMTGTLTTIDLNLQSAQGVSF